MSNILSQVQFLFNNREQDLVDVEITCLYKEDDISNIFLLLQKKRIDTFQDDMFWDNIEQKERLVCSVPNAALLVVNGDAQPFYFTLDLYIREIQIPSLGFYIFQEQIDITYKIGSIWGGREIEGFFYLLSEIKQLIPNAVIRLENRIAPHLQQLFQDTLKHYIRADGKK